MSTMREQFEAWYKPLYGALVMLGDSDQYQSNSAQGKWQTWQAATEAAKATGTAGELPPLPEADSYSGTRMLANGQLAPRYTGAQMREYGQACAEAARQLLMQMFLDPENQPTQYGTVLVARQPAPITVKTWRERFAETTHMTVDKCKDAEITDLRSALAATAAPAALSDNQIADIAFDTMATVNMKANPELLRFARAIIAATNRSQP